MILVNSSKNLAFGVAGLVRLCALTLVLFLVGCGGSSSDNAIDVVSPPLDPVVSGGDGSSSGGGTTDPSNLTLSVTKSPTMLNANGGTLTLAIKAVDPNGVSAEGQKVSLGINKFDGVSIINGATQTTDGSGVATFTIEVADNLTAEQKNKLVEDDITFHAILTEASGAKVELKNQKIEAEIPAQSSVLKVSSFGLVDIDGEKIGFLTIEGGFLSVTVVDGGGNPVEGALVGFSVDPSTGLTLTSSTSGKVQTDEKGKAQALVKANSPNINGVFTATTTVNQGEVSVTKTINFSVQDTELNLQNFVADSDKLVSGGQTPFSIDVVDRNSKPVPNIAVNFTAPCGQITEQQSTGTDGSVSGTYKAINADNSLCSGVVMLTATTVSGSSQSINVTVDEPVATSIKYMEAEVALGIQGSGAASTGEIKFTVYQNTTPLPNVPVVISKIRAPNDLGFVTPDNTDLDKVVYSDDEGVVTVSLYPGTLPGPVEMSASLQSNPSLIATSRNVSVNTGRATQSGFSISGTNTANWDVNLDEVAYTASLVDRTGNPVPEGTVVNFVAEGGSIDPSCSTNKSGSCEVKFRTQNPRPTDGRVSILAYVEGDKAYFDNNGDNTWSKDDDILQENIGNFFLDINEDKKYNPGEFIYRSSIEGESSCEVKARNGDKIEVTPSTVGRPNIDNTCNDGLLATLRTQIIHLMSGVTDPIVTTLEYGKGILKVQINSNKYTNNPLPAGTTISASTFDKSENGRDCSARMTAGYEKLPKVQEAFPISGNLGSIHEFKWTDACVAGDEVIVVISYGDTTSKKTYELKQANIIDP